MGTHPGRVTSRWKNIIRMSNVYIETRTKMKKFLSWLGNNFKLVLITLLILIFTLFTLWWGRKNRKIKRLENNLAILQGKLRLQRLALKKEVAVTELKNLEQQDKELARQIDDIKLSVHRSVKDDLTVDELAELFRGMGL
jgi:hypothetical protein